MIFVSPELHQKMADNKHDFEQAIAEYQNGKATDKTLETLVRGTQYALGSMHTNYWSLWEKETGSYSV